MYSQKTKIQILNKIDSNPVENVQIFSDTTFIDKTNNKGYFHLDKNKYKNITLVKEDYYDTIVNVNNLEKIIYLKKNDAIILKEVIITNINIESILDSIYKNVQLKNISITKNLHFFNSLVRDNDTLLYMNNRISHINNVGYLCEYKNKIINKHYISKDKQAIYTLDNNEIRFNNNYLHVNPPSSSQEFQLVTKYKKFFNYTVTKSDGFYKINFERKKNNKEYPYKGYIIVDIDDFGLYEFSCKTINDNKNKRNLYFKDKIINFKVINEESFIKYTKNENGKYELLNYSFDSQLQVLDGYFKKSIFTNKCRKEPTFSYDISNIKKIDLTTYKFTQ